MPVDANSTMWELDIANNNAFPIPKDNNTIYDGDKIDTVCLTSSSLATGSCGPSSIALVGRTIQNRC